MESISSNLNSYFTIVSYEFSKIKNQSFTVTLAQAQLKASQLSRDSLSLIRDHKIVFVAVGVGLVITIFFLRLEWCVG